MSTNIKTIKDLTISSNSTFKINLRILNKSNKKNYHWGKTRMFYIDVQDEFLNEIRIYFWNQEADQYYNIIKENQCYQIKNGKIKLANSRYYKPKSPFEIHAVKETKCTSIPQIACYEIFNNIIYVKDIHNQTSKRQTSIKNWFK